jgi:glucoamylase
LAAAGLLVVLALSGGSSVDPPIPRGFPGLVPAFMIRNGSVDADDGGPPGTDRMDAAIRRDRRWLGLARPLSEGAPPWARRMYRRSLLVLRASVAGNGSAVAGARPGWAYVWPRDAGAVAIALASAGYRAEARRIASFLLELELDAAARFDWAGWPIEGRTAQGDAAGWVGAAARAAGISPRSEARGSTSREGERQAWRDRADYQEKDAGEYLGNAIASGAVLRSFKTPRGLVRVAGDPGSGLDSAAAWAVRPFPRPFLYPAVRRTLRRLVAERETRFGLLPSEGWDGGEDPWTAPTAWSAWALATLTRIDRRAGRRRAAAADEAAAMALLGDLRRAATPLGLLPERVDADTGLPVSTTPLAWSHAFAILALRELWPQRIRH